MKSCCVILLLIHGFLFLQDNELVSIGKAIGHLSCLKVLMLHNNQLTKLGETVNEMRNMQALHTLSKLNKVSLQRLCTTAILQGRSFVPQGKPLCRNLEETKTLPHKMTVVQSLYMNISLECRTKTVIHKNFAT